MTENGRRFPGFAQIHFDDIDFILEAGLRNILADRPIINDHFILSTDINSIYKNDPTFREL